MEYGHHSITLPAASKQMQEVTLRLVKESFGETYYDKALDCVKALRSEAITVNLIHHLYTIFDVVKGGHLDIYFRNQSLGYSM